MSCKTCCDEGHGLDLETGIVEVEADTLLGDELELKLRDGFTLTRMCGDGKCIKVNAERSLEDVSGSERDLILRASAKKQEEEREKKQEKYMDPASNPLIRTDPE